MNSYLNINGAPMLSNHLTKKVITTLLAVILIPTPAFAEKILRYSDHEPLGGMRTKFIKNVFFTAIEKESKGRLKIEDHWNAELASGYDALRIAGKGDVTDMTIVVPEYTATELPLHQIFKSFPTGPAGNQQVAFFRRVYAEVPAFSAELKKNNVKELFLGTGYPVAFFSTTPLNTLDEINGKKWRSASFWHLDFLKNAGAVPVSMHWGDEIYKALKEHTLDGLMVNVDSGYALKVHETAPNVLASRDLWLGHLYLLVMNQNTWDKLAKEDQLAIQRAAITAYKTLGAEMDSSFNTMISDMRKEGVKVRELESNEVTAWKTKTDYKNVQTTWVKEQEDKGLKDAGAVLHKVSSMMDATQK
jgi:TRAP-type C4-dicarboxylate transport system, periplasmic component